MKPSVNIALLLVAGFVVSLTSAGSPEDQKKVDPRGQAPASSVVVPVYKPPLRGAPSGRIAGGTRGTGPRDIFVLSVLAPDHCGLTIREQPSLYWFISSATALPVEIAIIEVDGSELLLETRVESGVTAGVHMIRLVDHDVRLARKVYRWSVAVILDPTHRSRDILASGTISRVDPPDGLRTKLTEARPEELPFVHAEAGLWYDAVAAVLELIEKAPDDTTLRRQRASLLAQAGLPPIPEDSRTSR